MGLKGYVTNITAGVMPAAEAIAKYHDLWWVERAFRMSNNDLRARPMFHRTCDAIEAHLTIVTTALAVTCKHRGTYRPGHRQRRQAATAAGISHHRHQRDHRDLPSVNPAAQQNDPRQFGIPET